MKKIIVLITFTLLFLSSCNDDKKTITVLSWAGYNEADIQEFIESKVDVDLQFVTYTGGEDMLRKYFSNREKFDLLIVDAEYGKILYDRNEIKNLNLSDIGSAKETIDVNYLNKFKYSELTPGYIDEDQVYSLIIRWGTIGLVAQSEYEEEISIEGYNVLLDNNYENNIVIFDWYLPNMGIFSLMYLKENNIDKHPYDLNDSELQEMYNEIMVPLRSNIERFYADLGLVIQSAYEENTYFIPGIGEWAIANRLLSGNDSRNWYIPNQGGIIWIEAASIPKHVTNDSKLEVLYQIMDLMTTPEYQAKLAWRDAYNSQVPNLEAYNIMNSEQRDALKFNNLDTVLNKAYFRKVPEDNSSEWIKYWSSFKSLN